MFFEKLFLPLGMSLFLANFNFEFLEKIVHIGVQDCTFVTICISQPPTPIPTPTPTPTPLSNNKKCKDGNKRYSEGSIIERSGIPLVCKDGRFVPK